MDKDSVAEMRALFAFMLCLFAGLTYDLSNIAKPRAGLVRSSSCCPAFPYARVLLWVAVRGRSSK